MLAYCVWLVSVQCCFEDMTYVTVVLICLGFTFCVDCNIWLAGLVFTYYEIRFMCEDEYFCDLHVVNLIGMDSAAEQSNFRLILTTWL